MNLTEKQFEVLSSFADDFELSITTTYSGRGMYGKKCIGFTTEYLNLFRFGFDLLLYLNNELTGNHNDDAELEELIDKLAEHSPSTDNMGKSYIIYFPSFQYENNN